MFAKFPCRATIALTLAWLAAAGRSDAAPQAWDGACKNLWESEYRLMERELRDHHTVTPGENHLVVNENALFLTTDKDPLDVQLRRTRALLASLRNAVPPEMLRSFEALAVRARETGKTNDDAARKSVYQDLRALTRTLAFSNPLLRFKDVLFMGYTNPGGDNHMVDQYVGWNARAGGGLYLIRDFKTNPTIVNVLEKTVVENGRFKGKPLADGAFLRPDLSFDGKRIAFAWNNISDKAYHIFTVQADGSHLLQITDGDCNQGQLGITNSGHNDFDPCWLPGGRLAFLTDRRGGYGRCHGRPLMTYCLFSMKADGSDMVPLSYHETNEWNPSVDRDGKIVFTRWDYIDRDDCIAHHLWTCYPDGRDARSPHGNYPLPLSFDASDRSDGRSMRPNGEWNIRSIPGSQRYVATASGHHHHSFGQLVMIDSGIPDDGKMSQVRGITTGQDRWPDTGGDFGTAWPLSESFHLCNYHNDIILLDSFGNKELICPRSAVPGKMDRIIHPIPMAARPQPPVIPVATYQGERAVKQAPKATISVMNVYEGDMPYPKGMKAKWLRVIQIIPQLTPIINSPRMGYGTESLARIPLGVVPVESDGSVNFKAPVGKLLYFQLLDEHGLAVRSMRSTTYVHPGEHLSCVGCHESRTSTNYTKWTRPAALGREPSDIAPEVTDGAIPFNFHRLVQPVFAAKCVECHAKEHKGPDMSYGSLERYVFHYPFDTNGTCNGDIVRSGSRTTPGKFGAMASRLLTYLDKSHHGVSLTPVERHRITLWLDCNANEFGAYVKIDEQRRGEIVWPGIDCDPRNPLGTEWRVSAK
ncbi:MAG: hypothetical protein WCS43_16505 [Verrucomicrobiota bacterium]